MPPKVSVIVPNYNHAPYLRQRLDSIFNQTFQDFEVIILDDCSTDDSRDVIEKYRSKSQISHIIYNEVNCGSPFKQWAKGFNLAKGDYIWIAESDDWAEPNFLEELTNILQLDKTISMVFCDSTFEYPDRKERHTIFPNKRIFDGDEFIKNYLYLSNYIYNASCVLFKKDNVYSIDSAYQSYKGSGDWLFWINNCELGKVAYSNEPLNHFRRHPSNTTSKNISNGISNQEDMSIFNYLETKNHLSNFTRVVSVTTRVVDMQTAADANEFNKKLNIKEMKNEWRKKIKLSITCQTLLFLFLIILRFLSFSNTLDKCIKNKFGFTNHFENLSIMGLLWKAMHLPNTNIRSRFIH